jgi:glutathione S-transferase
MLQLYIGNKNYSSWSMRPWVAMRQLGIAFAEVMVRFDSFGAESQFKQTMRALSPTANVPLLVHDGLAVWDTLAIAEYLHEQFPQAGIWPSAAADRARARSICAEMHSGFSALRNHCPMNIEATLPEIGARIWAEQEGVRANVERLVQMWSSLLQTHGGPMLFGRFTMADAFFAPVCMRLHTYALPAPPAIAAYIDRVRALPAMQAWITAALAEQDFVAEDEPYRTQR